MADELSEEPVAAIPSGDHTVWADVCPLLQVACKDLQDGELIHGDNFNLFSAMSALEIMDPKMDSGIVCQYYSVDEAIENGAAPVPISLDRTVDVRCTIDIMDHLLACEATWHKGHSLAQTVFSCIYLLKLDRTSSHAILHSYCRVLRATCKAVIAVVSDTRTHEEEDLFTMACGLPLSGEGDDKCISILNAVEETISRQLRACKAVSLKSRSLEDIEPLQSNPDLEEGYCRALLCRIRFRKHFYHVLASMRRPQGRGLELARKHITSCLSEIELILNSSDFLQVNTLGTCEDSVDDRTTASGCQPIGFDSSLNSRLSAPTPPRAIKLLSWTKALDYYVKLLHDLDAICSYMLDSLLENVLRFVVQFQKCQPDLVARAHLQFLLVQEGKLYGQDHFFSVIARAAALPESAKNHDVQKNESIIQLGQLVINLLRILCTNSAWQRRKLGKILQDWRIIYMQIEQDFKREFGEALDVSNEENANVKIYQNLLVWVEEQTYWIATRFLVLGFELELYSLSEYCMVYWYLYVVLVKLVEKTHLKILVHNNATASNAISKRKGKKKRDTKDVGRDLQIPPVVMFLQCQICLAEGLSMMLAALKNECMILQSATPFNTEHEERSTSFEASKTSRVFLEYIFVCTTLSDPCVSSANSMIVTASEFFFQRFMQHFELLQKACVPDHVSFSLFEESTKDARISNLVTYNCFKEAQRIVKEVKGSFSNDPERLAELRKIEQVAEHNSIALNIICRIGAIDPSLKVSFEFKHHPFFGTVLIKRS